MTPTPVPSYVPITFAAGIAGVGQISHTHDVFINVFIRTASRHDFQTRAGAVNA